MSWGAMGGLGQAFSNIASNMAEMDKAKLRDKLEAERELAREGRQEDRDKKTVVGQPKLKGDTWEHYNKYGDVVKTRTATLDELKELGNAQRLQAAQTRSAEATASTAETELSWATQDRKLLSPEQRALSAEVKAGLALSAAEQDQSRRGWAELRQRAAAASAKARESSGADVPDSQRALALMGTYKYVLDDAIGAGRINAMEALRQAEDAITQAKATGTDAGKIFAARLGGFTGGNKGGRPGNYGRGLGVLIAPKYQEE